MKRDEQIICTNSQRREFLLHHMPASIWRKMVLIFYYYKLAHSEGSCMTCDKELKSKKPHLEKFLSIHLDIMVRKERHCSESRKLCCCIQQQKVSLFHSGFSKGLFFLGQEGLQTKHYFTTSLSFLFLHNPLFFKLYRLVYRLAQNPTCSK